MTIDTRCRKTAFLSLPLCLGMVLLASSLAHAATLEIPGKGDTLSGIGVISGWKCEAEGDITVRLDGGIPIRMVYGSERGDTRSECGDTDNGFLAIFNWALLLDGQHVAVAYDDGVEFDRAAFTVATVGEEFLTDARVRVRVPDFPQPGETTWFEWNEATQHLEMTGTIYIEDVCDELIREYVIPQGSADAPLLEPPPLPCPRDRQGDLDGEYFIQFVPDALNTTRTCEAVRGTTQGRIRSGRISATVRAPPHGRVRVSGEVCDNGFYIGSWTVDGNFGGIFTGGLDSPSCEGFWQDVAGCSGEFEIFQLPRR